MSEVVCTEVVWSVLARWERAGDASLRVWASVRGAELVARATISTISLRFKGSSPTLADDLTRLGARLYQLIAAEFAEKFRIDLSVCIRGLLVVLSYDALPCRNRIGFKFLISEDLLDAGGRPTYVDASGVNVVPHAPGSVSRYPPQRSS